MEKTNPILTDEAGELLAALTTSPFQMQIILSQHTQDQIRDPFWKGIMKAVITLNEQIISKEKEK